MFSLQRSIAGDLENQAVGKKGFADGAEGVVAALRTPRRKNQKSPPTCVKGLFWFWRPKGGFETTTI
jgi:hypothetical protein